MKTFPSIIRPALAWAALDVPTQGPHGVVTFASRLPRWPRLAWTPRVLPGAKSEVTAVGKVAFSHTLSFAPGASLPGAN